MNICFEYADKTRLEALLPGLFAILRDNMGNIAPVEWEGWRAQVQPALAKAARQLVLMRSGGDIVGFFQYYVSGETFMMEEIQLKPEYQGTGLFGRFFSWLTRQLPKGLKTVAAYAHADNHKSRNILTHLGLHEAGADGAYLYFEGDYTMFEKHFQADVIRLMEPAEEYAAEIWDFRQENLDSTDEDAFAGCGNLADCQNPQEWIDTVRRGASPETCPGDRVPSNIYIAVRENDGKIVGVTDLRHHIDHPILGTWGGHMGYYVRRSERCKGYATEMLRQNLEKARERGIPRVMVTCNRGNVASEKVILKCGGVFEKEVPVDDHFVRRFWIELEGENHD